MAKRVALHDFRLIGVLSGSVAESIEVGPRTPIKEAFERVAAKAREKQGLDDLLVLCHGFEAVVEDFDGAVSFMSGGFGLQLCAENLKLANVGVTAVLNNAAAPIRRIVVFSCAAADTHRASRARGGDGRRLMGEIAITTGARVVAARDSQIFHLRDTFSHFLFNAGSENDLEMDFGEWEGPVYEFSPDDGRPRTLKPDEHPRFPF